MTVGSLFAGIGGLDLGFERAGHTVSWCVEINSKCQSVLKKHFPDTKIYADVKQCDKSNLDYVDIITAGFPCQDCSVASGGDREGLQGARSGLFYEAVRIIRDVKPRYAVFENVPGLLTSGAGLDFASIMDELDKCGSHETAWRILDSRYFGVAQRRRRVFIVADFRGENASKILFEQEGLCRNIASGKREECNTSNQTKANAGNSSYWDGGQISDTLDVSALVKGQTMPEKRRFPVVTIDKRENTAMTSSEGKVSKGVITFEPGNLTRHVGNKPSETIVGTLGAEKTGDLFPHVAITHSDKALKFDAISSCLNGQTSSETTRMFNGVWQMNHTNEVYRECEVGIAPTLQERMGTGGNNVPLFGIRRLTPVECERLQGFPDGWTASGLDDKGGEVEITDSHRYKMLGNAVTVNVANWLGIGFNFK